MNATAIQGTRKTGRKNPHMSYFTIPLMAATAAVMASAAVAQHAGQVHHKSPHAELAARPVKALSSDQVADLQAGRGMGLSLPAELNGYPGPKHVLELADQIGLSTTQRNIASRLIDAMSAEAVAIGSEVIALETRLEALFVNRTADAEQIRIVVDRIASAGANLRYVHLKCHLAMHAEMTLEQIEQDAALRGYNASKP